MKHQVGGEQSSCGQVLQLWATVDWGSQGKLRDTHVTKIQLSSLALWPEIYICDTFPLCQSLGQTQSVSVYVLTAPCTLWCGRCAHCLPCRRGTCLFPMLAVLLQQPTTVQVCALEESSCHVVGVKNQEQTLSEFLQVGKLISIWTVITRAFFSFPFPLGGIFDLYFWMGQVIALWCPLRACAVQFPRRWSVTEPDQFLGLCYFGQVSWLVWFCFVLKNSEIQWCLC